jgi:AcrR family transcriptional regulator
MKITEKKETRGRPREFSSEKALDAAMGVFGEKGYEEASLSDLTKAMGINRPSMYSAFGNKAQLFRMALARYSDAGATRVAECLGSGTLREAINRLLRDLVRKFTDPKGVGGCFVTQPPPTGATASMPLKRDVAHKRRVVEQALRQRFDRGIQEGELPSHVSSDDLARFYSVLIQGMALEAQHGGTKEQLLRVVDLAMESWIGKTSRRPGREGAG